ncbi:MAG TPA: TonB family protein [Bryobacteraceae bacterium]|nr:TonB family protein [Bryobacteraceae bacterium]
MTADIREGMLAMSGSPAASIAVKATVVAALGLAGWWAAHRKRAAVGHAVLAATFAVLAVLPAASMLAPAVKIALPAAKPKATAAAAAALGSRVALPGSTAVDAAPVRESEGVPVSAMLAAAWMAGTAIFLLRVAAGLWQVSKFRRSAVPWPAGKPVLNALARDAGVRRRVDLLRHEALPGPMTCGVVRPAIVLSRDAEGWDADELERALVHELEHARRWDWAVQCGARVICAVYWFHPLVWMAWRRLALAAERACDDAVLGRSEATAYADQLVKLARRLSAAQRSPLLAMANRSDLARRVDAVLDGGQRRGRAGRRAVAAVWTTTAVLALGIAPLRVVTAAQQAASQDSGGSAQLQIHAETRLVIEQVAVLDARGQAVEGLSARDFKVTEDSREVTIPIFEYEKGDGVQSYYILGYYTFPMNAEGAYRKIDITGRDSRMAKLDYRAGYMDYPKVIHGWRPAATVPVTIPEGVRPPVVLHMVNAAYAEEARKAKYQGTVLLRVDVDETGRVMNVRVTRSLGLGLDEKAIEAVKQWRFRPALEDGNAISIPVDIAFSFQLM